MRPKLTRLASATSDAMQYTLRILPTSNPRPATGVSESSNGSQFGGVAQARDDGRRGRTLALSLLGLSLLGLSLLAVAGCGGEPRGSNPGPTDPDAPTEFTMTESGLKYRILRKSDGAKPTAHDSVTVDYVGWLDDESEFDNSYNRREPAKFALGSVIPGWTEGLQYVAEGGMIELEIPSALGYGPRGHGASIPGGATLHFKVELHEIQSLPRPGN